MAIQDLDLSKYQLGWSDVEDYVFKPKKGLSEDIVREMSEMKGEPDWMRTFRLSALRRFDRKPMAAWFAVNMPDLDFDDIYYYVKPTEGQVHEWEDLPDAIKNTYERLGIPEAERRYLAGVTAQYESEVVFHRNREDLESLGVLFCDMDTAVREYPELVRKYFGTIIPPNDNKFAALNSAVVVGRLVHLRATRRQGRHAPAGVLPDQHREHGPVRAHADYRGHRLTGALRRRLLGAGLHDRLAALRSRRARGARGRADHLHDDPELVEQRLQPRHQARSRRGGGPRRVDRREHRLEADDEVPERLPNGTEGVGRGALGRLRRRGPAPGRGRQDDPRRARDHLDDRVEVDLEGRRAHHLPRARQGRQGRQGRKVVRPLRRADPRRAVHVGDQALDGGGRERRRRSATRRRSPRSARTSSSTS